MDKYSMLRKLEGHHNDVVACEFSPDGALLATASYDTRVYLWDPHIGVILREFGWVKHSNLETISPSGLGNEQWLMEVVKWQRLEVVLPSESQVTALAFWGLNDAEEHTAARSPLPNPRWTGPALLVWECLSSAVLAEAVSCPWACLSVCLSTGTCSPRPRRSSRAAPTTAGCARCASATTGCTWPAWLMTSECGHGAAAPPAFCPGTGACQHCHHGAPHWLLVQHTENAEHG